MNLNNLRSEVSGFPRTDKYEMIIPQFETLAFASGTPKEFDMNNPGSDNYRDNPGKDKQE